MTNKNFEYLGKITKIISKSYVQKNLQILTEYYVSKCIILAFNFLNS